MNYPTLLTLRTKIRRELDLLDEPGISDTEINGYINDAITFAEGEIHTLYEDYFLTNASIALVSGQSDYDIPSDIYALKIRNLMYINGTTIYQIKRVFGKGIFEKIARAQMYLQYFPYSYIIVNASNANPKIRLVPNSQETSSTNVTIWYYRKAKQLSSDSDTCDIPEHASFIVSYAKNKIACNKPGLADPDIMADDLKVQLVQMTNNLTNRTPDSNDEVYMDMDFYQEHS